MKNIIIFIIKFSLTTFNPFPWYPYPAKHRNMFEYPKVMKKLRRQQFCVRNVYVCNICSIYVIEDFSNEALTLGCIKLEEFLY